MLEEFRGALKPLPTLTTLVGPPPEWLCWWTCRLELHLKLFPHCKHS
ncbi:hypothetical protein Nmel_008629, partial [Mimus melanotis]